jgi:DNA-binding NarL/FixJ family response regulator
MIRIVLVDDHAVVRNGYCRLLVGRGRACEVVGEAASADEANALVLRTVARRGRGRPQFASGSSGLEAIRGMLARQAGPASVLVLSMHEGAGHVTPGPASSGALGYLTKFSEPGDVIDGLRRVASR